MATLPIGVLVSFATLSTLVAPQITKLISRRCLFMTSSILGALGAGLMSYAVYLDNFIVFTLSAAPQGIAYGISNLYRFYATDTTLPEHREKALSAVVGGAVLSALIGPEASRCASTAVHCHPKRNTYDQTLLATCKLGMYELSRHGALHSVVSGGLALPRLPVVPWRPTHF